MRVLMVLHGWHPEGKGGTEVHARGLAHALVGAGHAVGVFVRTHDPNRAEYALTVDWDGPVSILRVNNNFRELHSFEWIYRNKGIHEGFLKSLESFKPDIVHIHHLTGLSSTLVEEVKLRKIPLVMTLHDFWMVCPRGQRMTANLELCEDVDREKCYGCLKSLWPHFFQARELERTVVDIRGRLAPQNLAEWDRHTAYILNLCDILIAPSEFHRERMLDFPIDPDRIVSLAHSLPWVPANLPERPQRPVMRIGFLGSVIPVKGVHVLIDGFLRLVHPDLELHIHGAEFPLHGDTSYGARLRDLVGNHPGVHFHGGYEVEDVPRILANLDVLVVPSLWWESFCLTLREALLAGVPVVASDLGAMREALDGEEDGLLFRPGDPDDLARVLDRLICDEPLRTRLSDRRGSVKGSETHTREMVDLYKLATERSVARAGSLLVAPPTFPPTPPPPSTPLAPPVQRAEPAVAPPRPIPWEEVSFALTQEGPATVAVSASMPTPRSPLMALNLSVREGDRKLSALRIEVDLSALDPARRPPEPPALPAATVSEGGRGAESAAASLPGQPRPVYLPAVTGTGPKLVKTRVDKAPGTVQRRVVHGKAHSKRPRVPPPKVRRIKPI